MRSDRSATDRGKGRNVVAHQQHVGLVGRDPECAILDGTVAALHTGESRVLVLHGVPGVGKTALLDYLESSATETRVLRAVGVEAEIGLAFATVHQLCAPLLDRLAELPAPQRDALATVFGQRVGAPPERFLVGLAVLSLLSTAAGERPVVCVVDDAQWMDRGSAQVLGFVARRLPAEAIALVFAAREQVRDLAGLPELVVGGLGKDDAHTLLSSATHGRLDQHVRDRIVAEAGGNPLALLELPRGLSVTEIAGGFGLLHAGAAPGPIEQGFLTRIAALPEPSRLLLLVAAAEPVGDPTLVWRAADRLGATPVTALNGDTEELLSLDVRVAFRHPLARSAVYRAARDEDRRAAHLALAEATDPRLDPDRRAWHLAAGAAGPDEAVASALERSAGRAQERGGLAAAAAFLQRSVELTTNTAGRAERAVAAADASLRAGDVAAARRFVDLAESDAQDDFLRARAQLVRGCVAFAVGFNHAVPPALLAVARRLEPFDLRLARETYLLAWAAAVFAAADGASQLAISQAIRALPPPEGTPGAIDLVLAGCAQLVIEGRGAANSVLRRAMAALGDQFAPDLPRWGLAACVVSPALWDDELMCETSARAVEMVRTVGALTELPIYLASWGIATSLTGDFATAAAIVAEAEAVATATGMPIAPHTKLLVTAMQGKEGEATALIAATIEWAGADGQLMGVTCAHWAAALLNNGLGQFEQAIQAARASTRISELFVSVWVLPELVEAAVRLGDDQTAGSALDRLADAAESCDTDWAQGILARCRALLHDDDAAEPRYREAVERLGRTRLRPDLARAHLLYGEWLRRRTRRTEARDQLRTAYEMFVAIGMDAFAERARRELAASGETVKRPAPEAPSSDELTPQERQIALLVRDGLSNPEVGARLFLSPRTVEWHLSKIFTKLGVSSRRQLRDALPR
jgi:DNA-binding CsgD family transcriptional regulator